MRARLGPFVFALATAGLAMGVGSCLPFHEGPMPGEPKTKPDGTSLYREVDGIRVHYLDVGKGPPVVMIHGFASSYNAFRGAIDVLSKEHRVIALDLKGFGWTDRPAGDYSPAAQGKLVFDLMDALGVDHAALVAHSWGSSVALQMALDHPDRVDRIALYDAWVFEDQIPTFFHWARLDGMGETLFSLFYDERPDEKIALAFYDKKYVTEELVENVERDLDRPGTTAAALAAVRGQRYADVEKRYGTIDKPVLLLWGREDKVTTLGYGERLSKELPNARLVVYPQCGHFPMIEAKAPSNRELSLFLAPSKGDTAEPALVPKDPPVVKDAPKPTADSEAKP